MTHDELLAKIKNNGTLETELVCTCPHKEIVEIETRPHRNDKALRAVVELHKPIEEDGKLWCKHETCYNHVEFFERDDCTCDYPCPTIQAIEKELG